jgi:D-alanyl-lipoteichoic acid acyltransferase DltB (MBOAT superfamily)
MSLGRFLTRYVLEPNLSTFRGRTPKLAFASSIFLVSAMWHGGTVNYLLWGVFHGLCYFGFGRFLKRKDVPHWLGVVSMLLFFVFGRMLAIDADGGRLLSRLTHFLNPLAYIASTDPEFSVSRFFSPPESRALILAAVFLVLEVQSAKHRRTRRDYHLMRRPIMALILSILFIIFSQNSRSLLYARL